MTDLFQDSQERVGEDPQAIAAIDEGDGNASSFTRWLQHAIDHRIPDALGTPESLRTSTQGTTASPLADDVESGPVGNVVGVNT
jgi:hypothetical protein